MSEKANTVPKVLVLYYSRSGNTKKMAVAVEEGAKGAGAETSLVNVKEANVDMLLEYDGIIVGTPTYYGVAAGALKEFFDKSVKHHGKLTGKVGGAFSSAMALGGGMETAIMDLVQIMLVHGMIIQGQAKGGNHYGVASINEPDQEVIDECKKLGERVAKLAGKLA